MNHSIENIYTQFFFTVNNTIEMHYFRILMVWLQNQGQNLTQQMQGNCWKLISIKKPELPTPSQIEHHQHAKKGYSVH